MSVYTENHVYHFSVSSLSSELGVDAPFPNPLRELQSVHRDTLVSISYFPKISYGPEDFADGTSGRYNRKRQISNLAPNAFAMIAPSEGPGNEVGQFRHSFVAFHIVTDDTVAERL